MTTGAHLSKELYDLIKSIGETRSKQEEDKIITNELQGSDTIYEKRFKLFVHIPDPFIFQNSQPFVKAISLIDNWLFHRLLSTPQKSIEFLLWFKNFDQHFPFNI